MMDDFPVYFKSIFNLLKINPDAIKESYIGLNDYFNLFPDDSVDLDKTNIQEYLYKCSHFMMTQTILRKDIDNIPSGSNYKAIVDNGKKIHIKFMEGIRTDIRDYISSLHIPLTSVNIYLIIPTITQEIVDKIKANFDRTMTSLIRPGEQCLINMKDIFIEYILTYKPEKYQISNTSEERVNGKEKFFKFIDNLLRFWSGSSFYKENEYYKIKINNTFLRLRVPFF